MPRCAGVFTRVAFLAGLLLAVVVGPARAKSALVVWDWWEPSNPQIKAWFDWVKTNFEAKNPDVEVQYQFFDWNTYREKLITAVAGGLGPDVAQLSIIWARDLYDAGLLADLTSLVQKTPSVAPGQFVPTTQAYNQKDGHIYGITLVMDSSALVYNVDMFDQAGLQSEPFALKTWEDLVTAAKKLTKRDANRVTRSGYSYWVSPELFTSWLYSNGGAFYTPDLRRTAVNSRQGLETLTFLKDLQLTYAVFDPNAATFEKETAAMASMGTWSGSYIATANPNIRFGMTSYPKGPSGNGRGTTTWGNMMAILKGTRNLDAAWRYVTFVTSLEAAFTLLNQVDRPTSPRLDYYRSETWRRAVRERPWMAPMPEIAQVGGPYAFLRYAKVASAIQPLLEGAVAGRTPPQEALLKLSQQTDSILAE